MVRRNTRKQRGGRSAENIQKNINQKEQELADLRAELKALMPNANDPQLAPFKKMQKMGIPEGAIRQKMAMAGVNASRLFDGPSSASTSTTESTVATLPFSAASLSKTLKKTDNKPKANNSKPKNPQQSTMAQLAKQVANRAKKSKSIVNSKGDLWTEVKDEVDDSYYVNPRTGESTWYHPVTGALFGK